MKQKYKNIIYNLFSKKLDKIISLKDTNYNEECYLFGDGPSLKWFDLKNFSNHPSFACGKILYHNDFNLLNLKYISLAEPFYFSPLFLMSHKKSGGNYSETKGKLILKKDNLIKDIEDRILKIDNMKFFLHLSNSLFINNKKNFFFIFKNIPNFNLINELIENNINPFAGSFQFAVLIMIYLGFKKIYLVGFDYYLQKPISGHWFEKSQGVEIRYEDKENEKFFNVIKKYVNLVTITHNNSSKYTKSIEYFDYCGTKPNFRENFDICSNKSLDTLSDSGWHSYRIY
tara:strand:- start:1289 stop:2146 length:858 start_codon:yes stop_codon:yes gene_type:complete